MPVFLDTRGKSKVAIAVCDRCKMKCAYSDLRSDGNSPGLKVCSIECWDPIDPWRLPPRETEDITLQNPRPDLTLSPGAMNVYARELQAMIDIGTGMGLGVSSALPPTGLAVADPVAVVRVSQPWSASTAYPLGAQVTEGNPVGIAVATIIVNVFTCIVPGISGASAPTWNEAEGALVSDDTVLWMNNGVFLES